MRRTKEFEKYIKKQRLIMYDTLELTLHDIINYDNICGVITISHRSDFGEFWVYLDFSTYTRIITFPTDIVYINILKGAKSFIKYIKSKLEKLEDNENEI